ncbi:MATE family efflux transporter [Blautia hansenii]
MSNSIAKDFKFFSLLRFALPTMVMMIFMSLYSIVDGIFISRLLGTNALSATNIVYPVISIVFAVGIMLSTGGSALIAKKLGEGKEREAREDFSFLTLVSFLFGIAILLIGNIFIEPIVRALGSTDALLPYCVDYLSVSLLLAPAAMLQMMFQTFFVTAGKPLIGLMLTISGGVANMILDYLFMGPFNMGISGAALATGIGELIPAVIGLFYFLFTRHSLYLTKPVVRFQVLKESCFNGSSEMVTNLSTAVVTYLFNITMLKFLGEPGVAAITIVLYGQFLFNALYMGFSMGVAPVISYNHGSQNLPLLKRIFKICIGFISISSILITIMALVSSPVIVEIFTPIGSATYDIAKTGFFLFSINYIFAGINIYSSSMFTAFSDGKVSALISFVRTFVLIVLNILLLPYLIGVNGVWLAVPAAEFMTLFLSVYLFYKKRDVYHYL